ncbi:hypothetical protein [Streptosporangium sp. NPDC023615]|uniref:hypothetical protein n=1 Tax=Streptosporangium sp. NPDC023615 TaxID=3154794 RepID=UPI00341B22B5
MTDARTIGSSGPDGTVLVAFMGRQWRACPGQSLTVGRSATCDVRLPDDEHLSRRAGSLTVLDDCVLIRNDSRRKPLVVRPPAGEDRVVEPGAATTSLPFPIFSVVFAGRGGTVVTVSVDARSVTPSEDRRAGGSPTCSPRTVAPPLALTRSQRIMLAALCEPLLMETGPRAVPATYAQIGRRLRRQPGYVRNVLKALRESLSGHGVPGLTADDDGAAHDDFRWALARWAVRTGTVTTEELEELPCASKGGRE